MMTFYLAASWSCKALMREHRDELHAIGHRVTSRWIDSPDHEEGHVPGSSRNMHRGTMDLEDICSALGLLLFTEVPSTTGGLHVEFGYALAARKEVIVIGPYTNIFHRQASQHFGDWSHFRRGYPL